MNRERVLFVDDEPMLLEGLKRTLRKQYDVTTASSGSEGLKLLRAEHYPIVVSDMQMPEMDGIAFLKQVKDVSPDSVRMMLTGNADQHTAVNAINEGSIFRFACKPATPEQLTKLLEDGLRQYQLIHAERQILTKTVAGSVSIMCEILSLTRPEEIKRASHIKSTVALLCQAKSPPDRWQIDIAANISQLGTITIKEDDGSVNRNESDIIKQLESEAIVAANLIRRIPRLDGVGDIVRWQARSYQPTSRNSDGPVGETIPLGSRMLCLAIDYDRYLHRHKQATLAYNELLQHKDRYDPVLLELLSSVTASDTVCTALWVDQLREGMITDSAILTLAGHIVLPRDRVLSGPSLEKLKELSKQVGVKQPISVRYSKSIIA